MSKVKEEIEITGRGEVDVETSDLITAEEKAPDIRTMKCKRNLRVKFSDQELLDIMRKKTALETAKSKEEQNAKNAADQYKNDIKKMDSQLCEYHGFLSAEAKFVDIDCREIYNYDAMTYAVVRQDTGEVVEGSCRALYPHERQKVIPGTDPEPKPADPSPSVSEAESAEGIASDDVSEAKSTEGIASDDVSEAPPHDDVPFDDGEDAHEEAADSFESLDSPPAENRETPEDIAAFLEKPLAKILRRAIGCRDHSASAKPKEGAHFDRLVQMGLLGHANEAREHPLTGIGKDVAKAIVKANPKG